MTFQNLVKICEEDELYEYPEMNNKIYLHHKGFYQIENLDKFVNLKTVYLENNMIQTITGLSCLKQLQHLFLQHNTIKEIEGLEENKELITLNMSHNIISKVSGLDQLNKLENLSLGSNQLKDFESIVKLKDLPSLSCLGLEDNFIAYDPKMLDEIFAQMPSLKVLYLQGNDFIHEFPYYRKKMIGTLKQLTYLDERPIFPEERILSEAFTEGGKEQMQSLLKDINDKKLEAKRLEQIKNQQKNAEVKQKRIIFFENNLKKSLIEIETLKKKLNRAHQISDPYLITQLEENIKRERALQEDIEYTVRLMKEGQKKIQENQLKKSQNSQDKENMQDNIPELQAQDNTSLIQKDDIEKLLNSLLLGTNREEEFDEDNLIKQLEETIQQIAQKIGKNSIDLTNIVNKNLVKQKVEQFKTDNPDHLRKIQEKRFENIIKYTNQVQDDCDEDMHIIQSETTTQSNSALQSEQNYLDDLE
ncbi:hypothetical protein ABPG72_009425 [Tetrahymena utriculariae]